ncbi:MAG: M1 family aminopeptidase [Oligoflexia bacterium]|nr:M1 family aminopeptidase [Oligoflexia bacterium]
MTFCSKCVGAASFGAGAGSRSDRGSFFVPGAVKHYAPDLPLKLEHIRLEVAVNPQGKTLAGTVTQRVSVIAPGQTSFKLDQVGLAIEKVEVGGKLARFEIQGDSMRVYLAESPEQAPKEGESFEFSVRYKVSDPRRGLYFTGPDADHPKKPWQVWSQGQDEDNRHWFPTFDYPNQKATSEVIATVPKGFTAVSNGALLSKKDSSEGVVYHYRLGTPHVTYLITLTVGEFVEWADAGPRGLPVQYFVAPGLQENGKRAFGNTPKMIEAYEKRVGVPYAYEKYSQVAVQDFIFGGMENTSATTQTDLVLHDARAHLDFSGDPLVSHELAHQWFGDLLTCRDWSHGWLNEGFATFMERVWIEENPGEGGGIDEAKYYQLADLREYLDEDAHRYRRPIVCNSYLEPIDLFDCHLYQKGGLVLNLIRHVLGADLFWKSVQLYVSRHRGQNVETLDLIRAIEEATGRNLRRLFDEWVFGAGHPELELAFEWHEDKKTAEISIEQKQTGGEASVTKEGATTHLFHVPAILELTVADGVGRKKITRQIELGGSARERVFVACDSKPIAVRFDPNNNIPKTLLFPRPKEMLLDQLVHDEDCIGRIEAALELAREPGKFATRDVVDALAKAMSTDRFWGVQAEAASALATMAAVSGSAVADAARDALIAALSVKHPKARRGIVKALGKLKDIKASQALKKLAVSDPSYAVEGEATLAWTSSMFLPSQAPAEARGAADEAEAFLIQQLSKESYREQIRGAALRALATLPGIARGERPKAIAALVERARLRTTPLDARIAAIDALSTVVRSATLAMRAEIFETFTELSAEANFRIRMGLIHALDNAGVAEGIPLLSRISMSDADGRVKRSATVAMRHLQAAGTTPESVAELRSAFEKLQEEQKKLKGWVEELRAASTPAQK